MTDVILWRVSAAGSIVKQIDCRLKGYGVPNWDKTAINWDGKKITGIFVPVQPF
ncbi:MAG: hypothetical protein IJS55_05545 [Oscillospiraceae bacterium]|nr:hypothetical protein [Oscillospiraceae bacterium]